MEETEIKLEVDPESRAAVAHAFAVPQAVATRLRATYWDTADSRLAGAGMVLRLRLEGKTWVQTAKGVGNSALHRLEHEVALPGDWPAGGPAPNPERHAGTPVGDRLRATLAASPPGPAAALEPRYTTDVLRRAIRIEAAGAVVEVAFDDGEIRAGEQSSAICEVEIESLSGPCALLFQTARQGIAAHSLWVGSASKAERGERLRLGLAHPAPVKAVAARLVPSMSLDAARRQVVASCLAHLLPNAEAVGHGSDDPDHVHQVRVALRRLRTALRVLGTASEEERAAERRLASAFRELGVLRDREVLATTVLPRLLEAGAPPLPAPPPSPDARPAAAVIRDAALQATLVDLIAYSMGDPDPHSPPAKRSIRRILRRQHQRLVREARHFEALPEERQHAVRKHLKRLRYSAEFGRSLFDAKPVARYLSRLEPAQEALGLHTDESVALALFQQAARAGDAQAQAAIDWLEARRPASAKACARCLRRVTKAARFFD